MSERMYGYKYGKRCLIPGVPIKASEGFVHLGGNYVKLDSNGYAVLAGNGDGELAGWLDVSEETASATSGGTVATLDASCDAVYRLPISSGSYNIKCRFKTCDLAIDATDKQGAVLDAAVDNTLIVVDGNNSEGWVDVKLNPNELGQGNCNAQQ